MDIDLPFAARLGVETADGEKDKKVGMALGSLCIDTSDFSLRY